jgi:hypothetical protein
MASEPGFRTREAVMAFKIGDMVRYHHDKTLPQFNFAVLPSCDGFIGKIIGHGAGPGAFWVQFPSIKQVIHESALEKLKRKTFKPLIERRRAKVAIAQALRRYCDDKGYPPPGLAECITYADMVLAPSEPE